MISKLCSKLLLVSFLKKGTIPYNQEVICLIQKAKSCLFYFSKLSEDEGILKVLANWPTYSGPSLPATYNNDLPKRRLRIKGQSQPYFWKLKSWNLLARTGRTTSYPVSARAEETHSLLKEKPPEPSLASQNRSGRGKHSARPSSCPHVPITAFQFQIPSLWLSHGTVEETDV